MRWMFVAAMAAITAAAAQPAEKPTALKRGPGLDQVMAHCSACHSLDYIPMNAKFLDAAGWNAEVAKMINAFGAPVDQTDAKAIAEYLGKNYGSLPPQSRPPAGASSTARQGNEAGAVRPKAPAARMSERIGIKRSGLHAARRRPEVRDPFASLFAMFEPRTCKQRGRTGACETSRASELARRQDRW